jgi:hypothetical protein
VDNDIGKAECNAGGTGIKTTLNLYSVIGSANFAPQRQRVDSTIRIFLQIPCQGSAKKFTDGRPIDLRIEKNLAAHLMVWAINSSCALKNALK